MNWYLLRTSAAAPAWNMALDEALLEHAAELGAPVLRLYSWAEPAATFGYSQKFAEVSSWTPLRPLIRRPTGGGLVPHDADWTYSLVFPPQHPWYGLRAEESYCEAHRWISDSFRRLDLQTQLSASSDKPVLGRCFIGAEKHDVLANGRKIAGAAQKRNKFGLLVQGSIQPPAPDSSREAWEQALLASAEAAFRITWRPLALAESLLARAVQLEQDKYATTEYNERR